MSVEGRISVDVLFHDKDGTNAVNVLPLATSNGYTGGKVAMVSGTVNTAGATFYPGAIGFSYRDAAGNNVVFDAINIVSVVGSDVIAEGVTSEQSTSFYLYSSGEVAFTRVPYEVNTISVRAANSTSTYTLIVYGT
jgi:hypothetical protein